MVKPFEGSWFLALPLVGSFSAAGGSSKPCTAAREAQAVRTAKISERKFDGRFIVPPLA
jgi:hypothetical protein